MENKTLACLIAACLLLFVGIGSAQVTTGTISGTVKDSSGAVLPGAKVVLSNQETGVSRTVQTDSSGRYSASSLSLGNYRVTASLEGFQTEVRTGIVLTVAREAVVDLALSVGAVTQTVEVAGEASVVETTNATVSGLVSQDQIRDLPLNGRSFADLALLSPGVLYNRTTGFSASDGFGQRLSVNGSRADANLYLIDGTVANNTSASTSTVTGLSLGVEGIREFRVLTHNFSAEYGRNSGAVVSVVTRSGTNQLHGSAYEFVRNNIFDARNFFNPGALPPFRRNQFGGAAGGPVRKDRIFFFANYEGLRQRLASTIITTVPDANARQGILPSGRVTVNPVIVPYMALYPLPNGRSFGDGTAQWITNYSTPTTEDYSMERMDFHLSDKDNFYWRYVYDTSNDQQARPMPTISATADIGVNHYATVSETHIFSGTALNDFRFAFNRTALGAQIAFLQAVDPSLSFDPGLPLGNIKYSATNSTSNAGTLTEIGNSDNLPFLFVQNLFQATDTFTLVRGAHSLKFGADFERSQFNGARGSNFKGTFTFGSLTDFLAGNPSQLADSIVGGSSTRERGFRRILFGWFLQDDYRVSSRLTLNLGFRHEFYTSPTEVNGRSASMRNITDPAATVGTPFETAKTNFAPRVGLAWDPTGSGKTSIRAGAGLYFNQVDGQTWQRLVAQDSRFFFTYTIRNPSFPRAPANPPLSSQAETTVQFHLPTPSVVHYGLDIQRQLTSTLSLRLGYVGSYAYNMTRIAQQDIRIATTLPDGSQFFDANAPFINPNFASIEQMRADTTGNYNGFQAMLQKSLGSGLMFTASYSFSKALSSSDTAQNRSIDNGGAYSTMVANDPGRDYSLSSYDQRHTFVFNSQYRMPWDRRLNSRLSKAALGGWEINGIFQYGSGMPETNNVGFNNSRNGDPNAPDRPNLAPGFSSSPNSGVTAGCPGVPAGQKLGTPNRWYDPCAFLLPAAGTYGDQETGISRRIFQHFQSRQFRAAAVESIHVGSGS
jgi:carboxypeptidase family protein/TonB-dependent receptor-like protein